MQRGSIPSGRRALLGLVLAAAVSATARADGPGEEAAARAYAREQLVRNATLSVDPSNRSAGGLEEIKRVLDAKRAIWTNLSRRDVERADLLLGPPGRDGLIQQGAILYRWLLDLGPEPVQLTLVHASGPEARFRTDPLPKDPAPEMLTKPRLDVQREPPAGTSIALAGIGSLRAAASRWPQLQEVAARTRREALEDGEADPRLDPLLLALVAADELESALCKAYVDARELQVAARVQEYGGDTPPRGLVSEETVADKALRAQRARERAEQREAQRSELLGALDRMAAAERLLKEEAGRLGFQIEEAKRKDEELRERRRARAQVAAKKDGAPKKAADAGDDGAGPEDEPPAVDAPAALSPQALADEERQAAALRQTLERLQLQEIVDEQQLRLLYISVRRASARLQLLERALRQVKEEAQAAEAAHKRYEAELSRMRRERQLERLAWQATDLQRERLAARQQIENGPEEARPLWSAYEKAVANLVAANALTRQAVTLRRELERRAKPDRSEEQVEREAAAAKAEEGCLPGEAPGAKKPVGAPDAAAVVGESSSSVTSTPEDELRRFRDPRVASMDASFVRDASEMLDHEDWDADLAAQHFVAVDERILVLEEALELIGGVAGLEQRFEDAAGQAEAQLEAVRALAPRAAQSWRWWRRVDGSRKEHLEPARKAFGETVRGIAEERERIGRDLALLRDYRSRLLQLGSRSFQIRVQRTLDPDRIEAAYDDVTRTAESAGRWVTFQGDEHAGTFAERHWQDLLACLGLLVASVFLVRYGRSVLDHMMRRLASRVPSLRSEPVTVRAEEAQARRERAEQEAAARATEEEALRQVSKEEAGRQQKMGEGGYGGGDDA